MKTLAVADWKALPNSDRCPCCGHTLRTPRCIIDLQSNTFMHGERRWRLSPSLAEFLFALREAWPRKVSYFTLSQALWGIQAEGDIPERRNLAVYASRGRMLLHAIGGDIAVVYTQGYRLQLPKGIRDAPIVSTRRRKFRPWGRPRSRNGTGVAAT